MTEEKATLVFGLAAVSHYIDPSQLAMHAGVDPVEATELLLPEVETEPDDAGVPQWVLQPTRRRAILAAAGPKRSFDWILMAPERGGAIEKTLRAWLQGKLEANTSQSVLQRVASWLSECRWVSPPVESVMQEAEATSLRERLVASAGNFIGREADRTWLSSTLSAAPHTVVVEAGGGMGKSALLARWLLDQKVFENKKTIGIVIDFDDPSMTMLRPDFLFAEIARQAAVQAPVVKDIYENIRELLKALRPARGEEAAQQIARGLEDSRTTSYMFSIFTTLNAASGYRVVVVLDTFERALRGPLVLCDQVIARIRALCSQPGCELIVAGRGPIDLAALTDVPKRALAPLVHDDAVKLLEARGVKPELVERILKRVPASPLTLRLCARAIQKVGAELLDDEALAEAIEAAQVDGWLHTRVIEHLPTPRLRQVARVALLLQTLTVDRLVNVVSPVLEKPLVDATEAKTLFDQLATVSDLARIAGAGEQLELRPEMFEEITRLIHARDPARATKLHKQAIDVFSKSALAIDQDAIEYHTRALAELTGTSATSQLRVTLTRRQLRAQVPLLLKDGRTKEALELVEQQASAQQDSGLLLLGARAAKSLGEIERCERLAKRAAGAARSPLHTAQTYLYLAWVAEKRGGTDAAREERGRARAELPRIAASDATVIEMLELITGLAVDDTEWARAQLRQMFARREVRAALVGADVDLVRHVTALVCTKESLAFAADHKAFDYFMTVDYTELADALVGHPKTPMELLPPTPVTRAQMFEQQRRSGLLSNTMAFIVSVAGHDERVLEALANMLDKMREGPEIRLIGFDDPTKRAKDISVFVDELVHQDANTILGDIAGLNVSMTMKFLSKAEIHKAVLQIDRKNLGGELVKSLEERGLDGVAQQAADLFTPGRKKF